MRLAPLYTTGSRPPSDRFRPHAQLQGAARAPVSAHPSVCKPVPTVAPRAASTCWMPDLALAGTACRPACTSKRAGAPSPSVHVVPQESPLGPSWLRQPVRSSRGHATFTRTCMHQAQGGHRSSPACRPAVDAVVHMNVRPAGQPMCTDSPTTVRPRWGTSSRLGGMQKLLHYLANSMSQVLHWKGRGRDVEARRKWSDTPKGAAAVGARLRAQMSERPSRRGMEMFTSAESGLLLHARSQGLALLFRPPAPRTILRRR